MFPFKNSGSGLRKSNATNNPPDNFSKVRTFREDLADFEKGKAIDDDFFSTGEDTLTPVQKQSAPEQPSSDYKSAETKPSEKKAVPSNLFQSLPTPPPLSTSPSSPTESLFEEKITSEENVLSQQSEPQLAVQKPKRKFSFLFIVVIFFIVVVAAGSGFYYYWFFIKNEHFAPSSTTEMPLPSTTTTSSDSQNKNLRRLIVNTSQNQAEIKNAVQKFATDFVKTASENDLVEVKILDKNNQLIDKKNFFTGFNLTIPETIAGKLSEDFSLFVKKEQGVTKLGLVFRTATAANLPEEMKRWESTISSDLESLFLDQTLPSLTPTFNTSHYKNADIRYFNFSSSANASLDYSVISNFLVIGTSKDSIRSILDYMSEK